MNYQYRRTALTILVLVSPLTYAGAPVAYDGWSVSGGAIDTSTSCATSGVSCTNLVSDPGMIYEEVTAGGSKYLRLILTDQAATGAPNQLNFTNEVFIPYALADPTAFPALAQGIASKQVVKDVVDNFSATTEVQRANMRQLGTTLTDDMFSIKINQSFSNAEMSSSFSHTNYTQFAYSASATAPDTDVVIGSKTDISQSLDVGGTDNPGATQMFVQRSRDGYKGTADPSNPGLSWLAFSPDPYFANAPITTAGSMSVSGAPAITWTEADSISTTWMVQNGNEVPGQGAAVAFQSIKNSDALTEDVAIALDLPVGTVDPFAWDANFGTAPSFP